MHFKSQTEDCCSSNTWIAAIDATAAMVMLLPINRQQVHSATALCTLLVQHMDSCSQCSCGAAVGAAAAQQATCALC
jgi:hypothetical protein